MKKMQETFSTSKSKKEIITEINYLKENYSKLIFEDATVYPIRFTNFKYFYVTEGRGASDWILNLDTPGEITVERRITFGDWFEIVGFAFLDLMIAVAFLILDGRVSLGGILVAIGIILAEVLLWYFFNVISPIKKIRKLVNKYLGGYE